MARPGITYLDVARAAAEIAESGEHPTIARVREKLRTGSNATIGRHIKEWREKNAQTVSEAETGLPTDLVATIKGLYDGIKQQAEARIAEIRETAEADIEAARAETLDARNRISALEAELADARKANADLESQRAGLAERLEGVERTLRETSTDLDAERRRLEDRRTEVDRLAGQLKQVQDNLEHYREATRIQREQDRAEAAQRIRALEHDIREASKKNADLRGANGRLEAEYNRIDAERRTATEERDGLIARLRESESALAEAGGTIQALEAGRTAAESRTTALEREVAVLARTLGEERGKLAIVAERLKTIESRQHEKPTNPGGNDDAGQLRGST